MNIPMSNGRKRALAQAQEHYETELRTDKSSLGETARALDLYEGMIKFASSRRHSRIECAHAVTAIYAHVVRTTHRAGCDQEVQDSGVLVCRRHQDLGLQVASLVCFALRGTTLPPSQLVDIDTMRDAVQRVGGPLWPPPVPAGDHPGSHRLMWAHLAADLPLKAPVDVPHSDQPIVQFDSPLRAVSPGRFLQNRLDALDIVDILKRDAPDLQTVVTSSFAPPWNWSAQLDSQNMVRTRLSRVDLSVVFVDEGAAGTIVTLEHNVDHSVPTVIVTTDASRVPIPRHWLDGRLFHSQIVDQPTPDRIAKAIIAMSAETRSRNEALEAIRGFSTRGVGCPPEEFDRATEVMVVQQFDGSFVTFERALKARDDHAYFQLMPSEVRFELMRCVGVQPTVEAHGIRQQILDPGREFAVVQDYKRTVELSRDLGLSREEEQAACEYLLATVFQRDLTTSSSETLRLPPREIRRIVNSAVRDSRRRS